MAFRGHRTYLGSPVAPEGTVLLAAPASGDMNRFTAVGRDFRFTSPRLGRSCLAPYSQAGGVAVAIEDVVAVAVAVDSVGGEIKRGAVSDRHWPGAVRRSLGPPIS